MRIRRRVIGLGPSIAVALASSEIGTIRIVRI